MLKRIIPILLLITSQVLYSASPAPIQGTKYMAVSTQRYATQVGANILKQGGNAIDAAVAMGYALAVVNPCCGNIGGGGFMLIRFADGKSTFLNFREKAPQNTKLDLFLDDKGEVIFEHLSTGHIKGTLSKPYLAAGVPGTVMGLNQALAKYGTMPLAKIIAPAIKLAEDGYVLLPGDASILQTGEESFKTQDNVCAIFLKEGRSYSAGEKLIQKNLANTLKVIAKKGTPGFYQGKIAEEIINASAKNGGLITKADLENYSVDEQPPLVCTYRGYQIITTPPPGSGVTICEALKILEPYKLHDYGFHAALGTHYVVEAMRFSYRDRNRYLGDPNFVHNPVDTLLSDAYIQKIRSQIKLDKATPSDKITWTISEGGNTTSYAVIDQKGNAVSVTYTLNDYFGAKVIPGTTGFFLNNEMADFTIKPNISNNYGLVQGNQNLLQLNKRPLSSMAPTILTKDNKLFLVMGTPGGSTIPSQLINVILNIIDYGMNIQEAEDAARFHMQWLPDKIFMEQFTFSKDTQTIMERMGYHFQLGSPYNTPYWGAVSGIMVDPQTSKLYGAMDSRRPSGAAIGE